MKPQSFIRWAGFVAAVGILLIGGYVHGVWSGRWRPQEALAGAVARVDSVPMEIGNWRGTALKTDETEFQQAGALSYWMRTYTHTRSKANLRVILMCGRAGRMSVHTPEICYQGAGFDITGTPEVWTVKQPEQEANDPPDPADSFWTAQFRRQGSLSGLRLYWAWNANGQWQAMRSPRWETRGDPFLYKMYVSFESAPGDRHLAEEFLREFVPSLQKTLFPE